MKCPGCDRIIDINFSALSRCWYDPVKRRWFYGICKDCEAPIYINKSYVVLGKEQNAKEDLHV